MTILNILTVGNDAGTLADKAVNLTEADILSSKIQTLIEDMKDTCHAAGGLGDVVVELGALGGGEDAGVRIQFTGRHEGEQAIQGDR